MKKTKVIIPALGLLVLSTAASVTGTVAWFSANNKVTVSGMTVSTQVKGNLLIASSNTNDSGYSSNNYNQAVSGILEPASTIDGVSFYYTKENVSGTGATTAGTLQEYTTQSAFATYYDIVGADAYKDYEFYLKATSDSSNHNVIISKINLLYNGAAIGSEKAWRVAVFASAVNAGASGSVAVGNLITIATPASATYFTTGQAWDTASAKGSVSELGSPATVGTIVGDGVTQRYHVVVRLFLEGEDTTCNNDTFAPLTDEYSLNLVCELDDDDGATGIVSQAAASVTNTNLVATVAQADLGTLKSKQWQLKTAGVWGDIDSQTGDTYTGTAGQIVRCKVEVETGVYYSNPVTLTAGA